MGRVLRGVFSSFVATSVAKKVPKLSLSGKRRRRNELNFISNANVIDGESMRSLSKFFVALDVINGFRVSLWLEILPLLELSFVIRDKMYCVLPLAL